MIAPHPPIILFTLLCFAVLRGVHLGLHSFCYRSELLHVCLEQSPVVMFHLLSGSTTILKQFHPAYNIIGDLTPICVAKVLYCGM